MFKFSDIQKRCCLTCQFFRMNRNVEVIAGKVFINYESTKGGCGLYNNFPKLINEPAGMVSFCKYKRWVELPD